ncbi:MAG: ABC transporter substrate-binding protein [Variibacter sp.]
MTFSKLIGAALLLGAAVLSAPAHAAKDQVVMALATEPPGLDPTMQASTAVSEVTWMNIFEGLTRFDESGKIQPALAESWTHEGNKAFTFKLRKGVKFHDGSELTAADVKFTFERNTSDKSTNKRKRIFANMESIETPDPLTVKITLKKPSALLPFFLAEATAAILSPKTAEKDGTNPIGTGPYKFVSWTRGDSLKLEKFADYNGPVKPTIAHATIRFINDENAQIAALEAGDVDYVPVVGAVESVDGFKDDKRFQTLVGMTQGVMFLGLNNKQAPFTDLKIRQALYHALDRQAVNIGTHNGYGKPMGAQTTPLNPYWVDTSGIYEYDVASAKKLLAEAGKPNGFEVNLKILPIPSTRRAAEIIVAQLAQVGVKVRIEVLETAQWLEVVFRNKNYDMTILSQQEPWSILNYTDPKYLYQYDSAEFRKLIDEAEASTNDADLRAKLAAAQKRQAKDVPSLWLYDFPKVGVARKELTGLWKNSPAPAYPLAELRWSGR